MKQDEVSDVADAIQRHLYNLVRSFESCDRRCLAQFGLTAPQGHALLAFPLGCNTNTNELSRALRLAKSTMTRMIDKLVTKKLVQRSQRWQDAQDRRYVHVTLTPSGEEIHRALKEARRGLQRQVIEELQKGDRPAILDALEKLNDAVEKTMQGCCGE